MTSNLVQWVQRGARRKNRTLPSPLLSMAERRLAARRNKDPHFDRACSLQAEGRHTDVPLETLAWMVRVGKV